MAEARGHIPWRISEIRKDHLRTGFRCGHESLDDFIRRFARQNEGKGTSRTFVATPADSKEVAGYYSLAAGSVGLLSIPPQQRNHVRQHRVPVVLLARLAVDERFQGQGVGTLLLLDALRRAVVAAASIGVHAIEVDAIDERARDFYLRFRFREMTDNRRHLYLPMQDAASLLPKE